LVGRRKQCEYDESVRTFLTRERLVADGHRYNLSKLLLAHAIIKLATIIHPATPTNDRQEPSLVINSLDPCFCKTELASGLSGGLKALFKVFELLFARTAEEGSRLVVLAASEGRQTHGKYMRGGTVQEYIPSVRNEAGQARTDDTWAQLSRKLEQLQPGIMTTLENA
jgi:retinol dehydrogenase 12